MKDHTKPYAKPGRLRVLLLAALVALAGLFAHSALPAQAQAAQGEVWSATLTVGSASANVYGFSSIQNSGQLTTRNFSYDGVDYTIDTLNLQGTRPVLLLELNKALSDNVKSELTLHLGGQQFPISDGTYPHVRQVRWANTGLSWSAGDTVQVKLVDRTLTAVVGSLDHTFGAGGKVTTAWTVGGAARDSRINDVATQPDGKIVAVGYVNNGSNKDFAIARYNADGSLDGSFGTGGLVLTDFTVPASHNGLDDEARAVAIQSDGKIVVAGYAQHPHFGYEFVVARYNVNGTLDTGFGTVYQGSRRGFAIWNATSDNDSANDVVIQTLNGQEHILLAGQAGNRLASCATPPKGRWTAASARFWTTCGGRGR